MSLSPSYDGPSLPEDADNSDVDKTKSTLESKFVVGDELQRLRKKVLKLRGELMEARSIEDSRKVLELERAIIKAQHSDAEFVYTVSLERMEAAEARGLTEEVEEYRQKALNARSALPQFNLDGLWVGKYGEHGYEMINITYVGDVLHAHKVTGDKNVPKGEISFRVNLSTNDEQNRLLEPIELGESAAKQWGSKFLSRFLGKGQVASEGYMNAQFIEGQLILVNEFFSFAWVPIGHQVFFGRPSPELTLKLLRQAEESTDSLDTARTHLTRCLEETKALQEDHLLQENHSVGQEESYDLPGCFE